MLKYQNVSLLNKIFARIESIIFVFLIFFVCSCNNPEGKIKIDARKMYLVSNQDSVVIGNVCFNENLLIGLDTELYPKIQCSSNQPPEPIDLYYEFSGIYINNEFYDSFKLEGGKVKKVNNDFDILYLYPEISRYNYQFSTITGFRFFHFTGNFFTEPSSRENLPLYIKSIFRQDDNNLQLKFIDKSNYNIITNESQTLAIDSLYFKLFPSIQFGFSNKEKMVNYIRISPDLFKTIDISCSLNTIPQDVTELYLCELVTKLVNFKYNSNYKTSDIIEVLQDQAVRIE